MDVQKIIDDYKQYFITKDDSYFEAWEIVNDLVFNDPEKAWQILLEMIQETDDKSYLSFLGAGPLEDLLVYHGKNFIERIENEAKHNKNFLFALKCVWQNNMLPKIWNKVATICVG